MIYRLKDLFTWKKLKIYSQISYSYSKKYNCNITIFLQNVESTIFSQHLQKTSTES